MKQLMQRTVSDLPLAMFFADRDLKNTHPGWNSQHCTRFDQAQVFSSFLIINWIQFAMTITIFKVETYCSMTDINNGHLLMWFSCFQTFVEMWITQRIQRIGNLMLAQYILHQQDSYKLLGFKIDNFQSWFKSAQSCVFSATCERRSTIKLCTRVQLLIFVGGKARKLILL